MTSIDSIIMIAVMVLTIVIGFAGYRASKSFMGFMFANKTLGPWLLSFSIMATYFSAASFLSGGGATYLYNLGFGAWLTAWHVIGAVLLWMLVADKLYEYVVKTKSASIPELIGNLYDSTLARMIASTVIATLFTFYLAGVYKGGAIVLATQLGIGYGYALLFMALPVIVYLMLGGMRSAVINNLFLGSLMLIAAALTFTYVMGSVGGPINGLLKISNMTILGKPGALWLRLDGMGPPPAMEKGLVPTLIMSVTFSIGMAQIALPNLLFQFYAAKDPRAISRGRIIGPILISLYAMLVFSLGIYAHLILDPHLSPQQISQLMKDSDWVISNMVMLIVPEGIRGLILSAPIAASLSTIAVTVLAISNTVIRDIVLLNRSLEEKTLIRLSKVTVAVFALLPLPIALIDNKLIIDIVSASFGTIFACFIGPVVLGLYWRKSSKEGAVASMIAGALIGIIWYIYMYRTTWIHPTIPAATISLALFVGLSMLRRNGIVSRSR